MTVTLKPRELSLVNLLGEHRVAPGEKNIFVDGAQPGDTAGGVRVQSLRSAGK